MNSLSELPTIFGERSLKIGESGGYPAYSRMVTYEGQHVGWLSYIKETRKKELQPDGSKKLVTVLVCDWLSNIGTIKGIHICGNNVPIEDAIDELIEIVKNAHKKDLKWKQIL